MTCGNCEATVKSNLLMLPEATKVEVSRETHSATITMDKHIALSDLQKALGGVASKYQITAEAHNEAAEQARSWWETYKPIVLIFGFITLVTLVIQYANQPFAWIQWMRHFMAGFFLVFSFFKFLNLSSFADSYAMYDVIARRFKAWGFIYPFVEFGLGIAYLLNIETYTVNLVAFAVMVVSMIGVIQSILNKEKIQCACLGVVFNLPMSTVTVLEDGLMAVMAGVMLFM